MLTFIFSLLISLTFAIETFQVNGDSIESDFPPLSPWDKNEDLFNKSINLNISSGGNRSRFFQIRGIGEHSQYDNFNQSSVSYFYDGIDLSEEPQALLIMQEQSIKVFRNSHSIEYGSKGLGGGIDVTSCPLNECDLFLLSSSYQSQNTQDILASLPLALSKNWQLSLKAKKYLSDGFQFNEYLNKPSGFQNETYLDLYQQIKMGHWKVQIHNLVTKQKNGYDHFSHNNTHNTQSDRPGTEELTTDGHSLSLTTSWSDFRLTSLTSLTQTKTKQSFDEDWGNNDFWLQVPGWQAPYDYSSLNRLSRQKWHQKIRLEDSSWQLGLHLHLATEEINNSAYKNEILRSELKGRQKLFNSALWTSYKLINTDIHLWTTDLRLEQQNLKLDPLESIFFEDQLWSFRSKNEYSITDKTKIEMLLSRSYRGGGFNLQKNISIDRLSFQPETLYAAEIRFLRRLNIGSQNLQFFYHFREHQQLRTSFQDDPLDPSSFSTITQNVGSSEAYGLEASQNLQISFLHISLHVGLLMSQFKSYTDLTRNLNGRETPYSPRYSFRFDHFIKLNKIWNVMFSYYGKDSFYFSNSHDFKAKNIQLVDISMNAQWKKWTLSLFAKNIFNQNYSQRGFYFSNEPPNWEEKLYTQPAPPPTFGTNISYVF